MSEGGGIQPVPRKRLKASDSSQAARNEVCRTLGKSKPGRLSAAWQGSTRPAGETARKRRPHPPMQALGRSA